MSIDTKIQAVLKMAEMFIKRFFRDKVALFFTFVFPLIFLAVFGGIFGGNSSITFRTSLINNADNEFSKQFVAGLKESDLFEISSADSFEKSKQKMGRGEYDVILEIPNDFGELKSGVPTGQIKAYYDESDQQLQQAFGSVMNEILDEINGRYISLDKPLSLDAQPVQTANLSQFDYLLSGIIGFSIMSMAIFGMANGFPADKKAGYLRRLKATPLRAWQLVAATALQYLVIGLLSVSSIVVVGILAFDFHMRGDWISFLIFTIFSIISMFGFGLAIGGWAKNENQAAPISQLVAIPMMFLSGVFFPRFLMPEFIQEIAGYLPLSPIIDGLRLIMTEAKTIIDVWPQLGIISIWGVIIYAIAIRIFRWE